MRAALGGSDKLHVTLVFLGERESADGIWESASAAAEGIPGPRFIPKGVVGVPRRRPRLFALDLEDDGGRGAALHAAVCEALEVAVERPFWPHVTLLRVRKGRPEAPRPPGDLTPFTAEALTLYRSHLGGRSGARYEALESRVLLPRA